MIYRQLSSVFLLKFDRETHIFYAPVILDVKTGYLLGCDDTNAFILDSFELLKERILIETGDKAEPVSQKEVVTDQSYLRALVYDAPIEGNADEVKRLANTISAMNKITQFFTTITKQ